MWRILTNTLGSFWSFHFIVCTLVININCQKRKEQSLSVFLSLSLETNESPPSWNLSLASICGIAVMITTNKSERLTVQLHPQCTYSIYQQKKPHASLHSFTHTHKSYARTLARLHIREHVPHSNTYNTQQHTHSQPTDRRYRFALNVKNSAHSTTYISRAHYYGR